MKSTTNEGNPRDRGRARAGCSSRARRGGRAAVLVAGALLGAAVAALGGDARAETADLPRVTYYPDLRAFSKPLPTKTQFILEIPVGEEAFDEVEMFYWRAKDAGAACDPSAPESEKRTAIKQRLAKDARRFEVPIQPLTHSAKYCFKVTLTRPISEADRTQLKKLVVKLVEAASSKNGLTVGNIGAETAVVFKDYADYRTTSGKKLIEQIDAWIKDDETWKLFMSTVKAWQLHGSAFGSLNRACPDLKDAIPALAPAEGLSTASRAKAKELTAEAEKLRTQSREIKLERCPETKEPGDLPAAPKSSAEVGERLGAFSAGAAALEVKICADSAADAKLFSNTKAVCQAITAHHTRATSLQENLAQMSAEAENSRKGVEALTASFERVVGRLRFDVLPGETSTPVPTYAERAGLYISGDVGFMVPIFYGSGDIGFSPLIGANFYFGPVDKDEPLEGLALQKRVALTGGIAFNVKDPAGTTSGLVGDTSVFAGVGARVTDYLRVSLGATLVNQKDPDPLVTGQRVRAMPYVAASVDVDVAGTLKDIFSKDRPSL